MHNTLQRTVNKRVNDLAERAWYSNGDTQINIDLPIQDMQKAKNY